MLKQSKATVGISASDHNGRLARQTLLQVITKSSPVRRCQSSAARLQSSHPQEQASHGPFAYDPTANTTGKKGKASTKLHFPVTLAHMPSALPLFPFRSSTPFSMSQMPLPQLQQIWVRTSNRRLEFTAELMRSLCNNYLKKFCFLLKTPSPSP